ncbi:MAG: hypothetical protein ACTSPS_11615 [Promethearchaeota archaeon]
MGENKPQLIEIKETLNTGKYTSLCCILFFITIFTLIFAVFLPLNAPPFVAGLGFALYLVFMLPVMICGLIFVLRHYRNAGIPRTFYISDKEIKIMIPKKPVFQINWSDIEKVYIKKQIIYTNKLFFNNVHKFFILNFFKSDGTQDKIDIERRKDFKNSTSKKICKNIGQFSQEKKIEFSMGKKNI